VVRACIREERRRGGGDVVCGEEEAAMMIGESSTLPQQTSGPRPPAGITVPGAGKAEHECVSTMWEGSRRQGKGKLRSWPSRAVEEGSSSTDALLEASPHFAACKHSDNDRSRLTLTLATNSTHSTEQAGAGKGGGRGDEGTRQLEKHPQARPSPPACYNTSPRGYRPLCLPA